MSEDRRPAGATQPSRRTATSTVEDYLKCILVHEFGGQGQGDAATRGDSARVSMGTLVSALGVAPGTVTAMMKTLADARLVDYAPYSGVKLTDSGRRLATHVLRRHRLIELFLVEILKLDWSQVHAEAELLEHAVSDGLIERMDEILGYPKVDPHGDPIPSSDGRLEEPDAPTLLQCPVATPQRIVRVLDQSSDFLQLLERNGLVLGARIEVTSRSETADAVEIEVEGEEGPATTLGFRAAAKVFVEPR